MLEFSRFPLQIVKHARSAFDGDNWLFEIKHDGFRVLALRDGGSTRLFTRKGYDIDRRHKHMISKFATLPAEQFVLDVELVARFGHAPVNSASASITRFFYTSSAQLAGAPLGGLRAHSARQAVQR